MKFKEVNEAYAVLSDADKRSKYDRFGHAAFDPSAGGGSGFGGFGGFGGTDFDFGDIFSSFFGGGGGRSSRQNAPIDGDDVATRITISFDEAAFGCKKEVNFARIEACSECGSTGAAKGTKAETCSNCRGTGQVTVQRQTMLGYMQTQSACQTCRGTGKIIKSPCKNCNGKGRIKINKKLEVNIPAGIDHMQNIILRGQGSAGVNGGANGDLIIEVRVKEDKVFTRDGYHIYCEVPISFTEAALGADIDVPLLGGKTEKLHIPEGTQSGTSFTLRGKGIPNVNTGKKGDLIITAVVETPRNLTQRQKDILAEFAGALDDKSPKSRQSLFSKLFNK